ncbi:MAG: ABC transporter permease, partial [Gammaproteobacteria bacterium]
MAARTAPGKIMLRFYELSIALRYLQSQNKNRFVSFISLISVIGIALAVAVLIVVLSVMSGFEYEVRNRILNVVSHASISGIDGRLDDWRRLDDVARGNPDVYATAPFVQEQGMAVGTDSIAGVQLRGIKPAAELAASSIGGLVVEGSLSSLVPGSYGIVLGRELAGRLSARVGDRIILLTTKGAITPAGFMPRMRRFEVVG